MPQFDPSVFSPQIVWLAISFVVFYFLMARVALPRVAEVLETRQDRIANDLDQAEQLKQQAEKVIAQYEQALAEARSEAQSVLASAAAESKALADRRNAEVGERLQKEAAAASERIDAAKAAALAELRGMATELAQAAAERLIGSQVPASEVEQAVDEAIQRAR